MLTILSGVYVPDSDRWPERFRGIGIRIEDSVCVGDESPIVLTTEAVKEVYFLPDLTRVDVANERRWMISRRFATRGRTHVDTLHVLYLSVYLCQSMHCNINID